MTPTQPLSREEAVLQRIVDDHSERRIGNGLLPTSDEHKSIIMAYECARPIPDIALARGITVAEVMEVLGLEWYCSRCGMGADLGVGRVGYATEGDQEIPCRWETGCATVLCSGGGAFVGRDGREYREDPREVSE